jgi:cobalamin biosynthesis protein CobC
MTDTSRDHGGGVDAAIKQFGGARADWLDLSTGINPVPYPLPELSQSDWTDLPDAGAMAGLLHAARRFWHVPQTCDIVAAPGASALIARIPYLLKPGKVDIQKRTYNEHAAAFESAGWTVSDQRAKARVIVHPNNPDGQLWDDKAADGSDLLVIDESFCDVTPGHSKLASDMSQSTVILKSFGKFWGLAGARLGFAIGAPKTIARLGDMLGPWPVSGPTMRVATAALSDFDWADQTRKKLQADAARLDHLVVSSGKAALIGGTNLFRLYRAEDAAALQTHLARHHILTRTFPYSGSWLRLGLPASDTDWNRLENALISAP